MALTKPWDPDLNAMADALGVTQRQLDDIFTEANTL